MADAAHPTPHPGLPPDAIEGYRILRVLGQGGMATVYAAQQAHPKRTVAIKVMRPSVASPQMLRRFRKEIDLLAKLSHPCIAQIYAAGVVRDGASELPYFVMEHIPSARTILEFAEDNQLERATRLKLFVRVCAAIDHGHRQRVLHLDLKPGNVLINREGHVKVIDFGVARAIEQTTPDVTAETKDTAILGSLHAMSPEQIDPAGRDLDARSDVYSLGVLLYRLLLGVVPLELSSKSIVAAARTICEAPPRKPRTIDANISPALEGVMLRALQKDPALRYRNAGELGDAIVKAIGRGGETQRRRDEVGASAAALPAGSSRDEAQASGKWVAILTGVVLIAALVFTFAMLQRERESNAVPQNEAAPIEREVIGNRGAPFTFTRDLKKPVYLLGHAGLVTGLSMAADGTKLASSGQDRIVRVWDLETQKLVCALAAHEESTIECVALSADGAIVASGAQNGLIVIEKTQRGSIEHKITVPTGPVHFLVFGPNGELAGASDDLTARIWDADFHLASTLRSATGAFTTGAFSAEGSLFATASTGGHVYVWDLNTRKEISRHPTGNDTVHSLAFSADISSLTILTANGAAVVFDPRTGERLHRFAVMGDTPTAVALDAEGEHMFVARQDRSVEVWNIANAVQVYERLDLARTATRMIFSSASNRLVIGSAEGAIEVRYLPLEN
jgi:tRNA A-37 threonylcarbamoyl transferase component Bud32